MKNKKMIWIMTGICLLTLGIMVWALRSGESQKNLEFVPPSFEETAVSGVPDVPENLGWGELDAKAFKVSVCGMICADEESADVWLTNPESNNIWLKLRLLDEEGNVLGETGLLHPGEYVRAVSLNRSVKQGEKVALKIMSYEPETFYSEGAATLNTTINRKDGEQH